MAALTELSATQLARALRARELSPVEVVDAYLARVEAENPALNAIVTLRADDARREAAEAERALARGEEGPLLGVPFTVKDVFATAGVRTTCGTALLADHVPAADATAVARLRAAGGIMLGKTNCSELALWPHTANPLFGETRSPLGPVSPGGSSGGESAAIAARLSPLGLACDFGGSLRWPAQCTGIASIRPTVGRIPGTGLLPALSRREPAPPNSVSLQGRVQVAGPMARTVADLELALGSLCGPDGLDPAAVPVPLRPSAAVDVGALRIAWCDGDGVTAVRADLVAVVERAAARLGASPARPAALERANDCYSRLRAVDGLYEVRALVAGRESEIGEPLRNLLATTGVASMADLATLWIERDELLADFLAFLEEVDVLLLPVAAVPAYDPSGPARAGTRELTPWEVLAPCRAISLFGVPAAAVPCGFSVEGLPVCVQVVGRPFREDEVLAVAAAIESVCASVCASECASELTARG